MALFIFYFYNLNLFCWSKRIRRRRGEEFIYYIIKKKKKDI